jgi:hypothetical protein
MAGESKESSHLFWRGGDLETFLLLLLQALLMKSNSFPCVNHTAVVTILNTVLITQLHTDMLFHTSLTNTTNKQCYSHCGTHKGTAVYDTGVNRYAALV